jgi:hypothetical protein
LLDLLTQVSSLTYGTHTVYADACSRFHVGRSTSAKMTEPLVASSMGNSLYPASVSN